VPKFRRGAGRAAGNVRHRLQHGVPEIADDVKHETEQFVLNMAKKRNVAVMAGVVNRDANGKAHNEALIAFPDGRSLCVTRKCNPLTSAAKAKLRRRE